MSNLVLGSEKGGGWEGANSRDLCMVEDGVSDSEGKVSNYLTSWHPAVSVRFCFHSVQFCYSKPGRGKHRKRKTKFSFAVNHRETLLS